LKWKCRGEGFSAYAGVGRYPAEELLNQILEEKAKLVANDAQKRRMKKMNFNLNVAR
jgi:hypothetical protein